MALIACCLCGLRVMPSLIWAVLCIGWNQSINSWIHGVDRWFIQQYAFYPAENHGDVFYMCGFFLMVICLCCFSLLVRLPSTADKIPGRKVGSMSDKGTSRRSRQSRLRTQKMQQAYHSRQEVSRRESRVNLHQVERPPKWPEKKFMPSQLNSVITWRIFTYILKIFGVVDDAVKSCCKHDKTTTELRPLPTHYGRS